MIDCNELRVSHAFSCCDSITPLALGAEDVPVPNIIILVINILFSVSLPYYLTLYSHLNLR